MGQVYECTDPELKRKVAVKVLLEEADEDTVKRFQTEARAMANLKSRYVADVLDFGVDKDRLFLVMEYLDGEPLDQVLKTRALELEESLEILIQVAKGLEDAHRKGIIHRDLKPSNIFLAGDEKDKLLVKLIDFGIAKIEKQKQTITNTGAIVGTPAYVSPEAAGGSDVDPRADQYSYGCLMFEILTGSRVFQGNSALETIMLHMNESPPTMAEAGAENLPDGLETIVAKCLSKTPAHRYKETGEIVKKVEEIEASLQTLSSKPEAVAQEEPRATSKPFQTSTLVKIVAALICTLVLTIASTGYILEQMKSETPEYNSEKTFTPPMPEVKESDLAGIQNNSIPRVKITNYDVDGENIKHLKVTGRSADEIRKDVRKAGAIHSIEIKETSLQGKSLDGIFVPSLEKVRISKTPIDREVIEALTTLRHLEEIVFSANPGITEDDIALLSKCKELKRLRIRKTKISDNFFKTFARIPNLKNLKLEKSFGYTGRNISLVKNMKVLNLSNGSFENIYLKDLKGSKKLVALALDEKTISSKDLEPLKHLPLKRLSLYNCKFKDPEKVSALLLELKSLRRVNLSRNHPLELKAARFKINHSNSDPVFY